MIRVRYGYGAASEAHYDAGTTWRVTEERGLIVLAGELKLAEFTPGAWASIEIVKGGV